MRWLDKIREKCLLRWIAIHDIQKKMYKFFYGKYGFTDNAFNPELTNIDEYLYGFIEQGGVLIYAYDKEVYHKVKACKKQHINYLFVEYEWMTKLNDLVEKKDKINNYNSLLCYTNPFPTIIYTNIPYNERKFLLQFIVIKDHHYIWVGSDRLEEEIEECKRRGIQYRFTIQKNLIEELYGE